MTRAPSLVGACTALSLALLASCSRNEPAATTAPGASTPTAPAKVHRQITPENARPGELVTVREFYETGELYTERTERVVAEGQRVRVGKMRAQWENGKTRLEGEYDDQGRLTGHWRYYFETGALEREGAFETGKHSGVWTENWLNGKLRYEGFYHLGLREGFWRTWHENGAPESEGEYVNNLRTGPWKFWTADGNPDPALTGEYAANVKLD